VLDISAVKPGALLKKKNRSVSETRRCEQLSAPAATFVARAEGTALN